jgi:hypothetical protein
VGTICRSPLHPLIFGASKGCSDKPAISDMDPPPSREPNTIGTIGSLQAVEPGPGEPRGRWLDSWVASKLWPARTLKHPPHRPWGYLRIERIPRATLVSGAREPNAVTPARAAATMEMARAPARMRKRGREDFVTSRRDRPSISTPFSHHLVQNRHFPSSSFLLPRARKVSRWCWQRRRRRLGYSDNFD